MAIIHKYTAKENQSMFTMAREGGARTRTTGAKCVVAQYAWTDIRKHSFAVS
jgi:hypothetical protein